MSINLASLPASMAGQVICLNTEPQIATAIQGPSWASACTVGGVDGDVWIITNPLLGDGAPVVSGLLAAAVVAPGEPGVEIDVDGGRVCSAAEMAEPEGQSPTGTFFWLRYD